MRSLWSFAAFAVTACGPPPSAHGVGSLPVQKVSAPAIVPTAGDPARALLEVIAEFAPENLTALGLPGHESEIVDTSPDADERLEARLADLELSLRSARATEEDAERKLDLELVARAASMYRRQSELDRRTFVAHEDAGKIVYAGLSALLTSGGVAKESAADHRISEYVGGPGHPSVFEQLRRKTEASATHANLSWPTKAEIQDEIAHLDVYLDEIAGLLAKRQYSHSTHFDELRLEARRYVGFLQVEVLPRARDDFRLPPAVYALALERTGVTEAPDDLATRARAAYAKTRTEMDRLAPKVATARKLRATTATAVLDALKKQRREGDELLALYRTRLEDLQRIIVREKLVSLPDVPVRMRLATLGETAQNPSPSLDSGALFAKDAPIDFIFPRGGLVRPGEDPNARAYTDFTYDAASWVIAAHEARPGHELQFSAIKHKGLTLARTLFAFNSVNVEGWGLYAEHLVYPWLPPEAQLVALRMRALREARAFLDPGLHDGTVQIAEARALLRDELAFSSGVIEQELNRYTYESPTQATAYFVGYESLLRLRAETERDLGAAFDPLVFHDVVLGAGLLPPDLQRAAVRDHLDLH